MRRNKSLPVCCSVCERSTPCGGIGMETIETAIAALKPLGRLVANAVTLESEAVLLAAFARHGGELERIAVQAAEPVGPYHGWRASMPVTQWSWQKALNS
jgi:precorrin-6Y C5,15-methyltransferase (decarboxylating)